MILLHLTTRIAKIKKNGGGGRGGDQTLVRMWNDWNFHILGEGTQNAATTLENRFL